MGKEINNNLLEAVILQDIEKVKYYLTSPELSQHADIDTKDTFKWTPLMYACFNNDVNLVKYFLTSSELKVKSNIHLIATKFQFNAFMIACLYKRKEVVSYLIFDYQLQPDNKTLRWLKKENNEEVLKLFQIRSMNKEMSDKLDRKNTIIQRKI